MKIRTCIVAAVLLVLDIASVQAEWGSDNNGCYLYSDTIDPQDGQAPAFDFIDITASGTPVSLTDDAITTVTIGFDFRFYGLIYSDVAISSNGFIELGSGSGNGCCSGYPIPSAGSINKFIAGTWADLNPSVSGDIFYATLGIEPDRVFVVSFLDVPTYSSYPVRTYQTWQIKLFEGSDDIEVHYQHAERHQDHYNSFSAGIEDSN